MKFNFIATTFRYQEDSLIDELKDLFYEFEDLSVTFNKTNIDGLIIGFCLKDPMDFVILLRNKIKNVPWEIRYLLRFIPVEKVVLTDIIKIKETSQFLMKKIPSDTTFKIVIEKRHTNIKKMDIINEIAPLISTKVDLDNPLWVLLIEILGKYTGVSVLKSNVLFSSMIEKRVSE
jgi:tRNA acetyltransferase TAN1